MAKKKRPKIKIHFPRLFWVGAALISVFTIYKIHLIVRLSFFGSPPDVVSQIDAPIPQEITIDAIKLKLPIYPTVVKDNTWQVADNGISYLTTSARVGQKGSLILYGHNTNSRFGPIRWLKIGDQIKIKATDQQTKSYKVSEVLTVSPSQIDRLISDSETLILYTCTGLFDSQRFIVKATPEN